MPTVGTMTDTTPQVIPTFPHSPSEASGGSSTPPDVRRRRRRQPQPTFHLNIGRVEVPRSLPPMRTIGTQTDESACKVQAELNKAWYRRTVKWVNKWVMPILRAVFTVLAWVLSHIGFGFRLN